MTMPSIDDVATYVIGKFSAPISTMKLQKLCYMAQGWSLAITDEPLFSEDFEAWKNGPVNYRLFNQHRGMFLVDAWSSGDPSALDPKQLAILYGAIKNYGALNGSQLGDLTHQPGTPWSRARANAGVGNGARTQQTIPKDDIRAHFKRLLGFPATD